RLIAGIVATVFLLILSQVQAAPRAPDDSIPLAPPPLTPPQNEEGNKRGGGTKSGETNALVTKAVDGDTLHVRLDDGTDATVRLLGVNTPETVDPRRPVECFGKEASAFTKAMTDGKRARLEADPQADEVDKYGRLLRNVFLEDGTDLIASLIGEGYGYAYVDFPQDKTRKAELMRLEEEARDQKRGLWADGVCEH
ncbi:MAG: thermonuclease family protein, partial [Candidatus Uhrbacteria bacterium]|nr:thermonuclease family protein [Candidatus Uhrbacteria bacterium]